MIEEKIQCRWRTALFRERPNAGKLITFLQELNLVYDPFGIHKDDTVGLLKQHLTGPDEAAVKARAALSKFANVYREGGLKS